MHIQNLKRIFINFTSFFKFFIWFKNHLSNLSRLKDVFMMMLTFNIWPEQTYRFSTRKFLPSKKNKFTKESKSTIPFEILKNKCANMKKFKEINVIGRGASLNLNDLKKITGPIFLISFWYPLVMDRNENITTRYDMLYGKEKYNDYLLGDFKNHYNNFFNKKFSNKDLTYVACRRNTINYLKKNGHKVIVISPHAVDEDGNNYPLRKELETFLNQNSNNDYKFISVLEKLHKPLLSNHEGAATGSFLPSLSALSYFTEKINVYGWDFYLESSPKNMNYWQLLFNMYKYNQDFRSRNHFESALINFYYGYKFSKMPQFNIYSHLGQLNNHEKLIKRIERVLFN